MRSDMKKTKICSERYELLRLISSAGVEITGILADLGEKIIVTYKEEGKAAKNTNVVVAAVTTAHARILLYKLLYKLRDSLLYFDTGKSLEFSLKNLISNGIYIFLDSVLYVEKRGHPILKCEEALGGLSDEVLQYGEGAEITAFSSGGAKNYAYVVKLPDGTTKAVRKVKGISIRHNCSEETSMETLEKLITGELKEVQIGLKRKIERQPGGILVSSDSTKRLRLVYDKRYIIDGVNTRPWGTKQGVLPVVPDPNIRISSWELRDHFA